MSTQRCGYVAIVGRPNVGKSTFVNALMQSKICITSKRPQTTTSNLTCVLSDEDLQCQVLLVDTPGLNFQQKRYRHLHKGMHQQALNALKYLDLRCWIIEAGGMNEQDRCLEEILKPLASGTLVIINKIDTLPTKESLLPLIAHLSQAGFQHVLPISALKNKYVDLFVQQACPLLPEQDFFYAPQKKIIATQEFLVSEIVREKLMRYLGEEVPYLCHVTLETCEITAEKFHIRAAIIVPHQRYKKIVVGQKGQMIKSLGQAARQSLEHTLGTKGFLGLWVQVSQSKNTPQAGSEWLDEG